MQLTTYSHRYAALSELTLAIDAAWLSPVERTVVSQLRDRHRQTAWLAGRLLVKQLLSEQLLGDSVELDQLAALEIQSRNANGGRIRPRAMWRGEGLDWFLSISHSRYGILVAIAPPGVRVGVDLVSREERLTRGFTEMWFTPEERSCFVDNSSFGPALVGAKEAAYKALNHDEPFAPRRIFVQPLQNGELVGSTSGKKGAKCHIKSWFTPQSEYALLATCTQTT